MSLPRIALIAALAVSVSPLRAEAQDRKLVIVALGDSTTAGTPAYQSPLESPPEGAGDRRSQYAYWLMQENPSWTVINQGMNGQRTDQMLDRFESSVLAHQPHVLVVLAGVNDLYQGKTSQEIIDNLEKIYLRAEEAGIKVVTCSILPYNDMSPAVHGRMVRVNLWIENYSRDNGYQFCDLHHLMEDPFKPGKLRSTKDGRHPDVEGHRKMAHEIAKAIYQTATTTA